MLIRYYKIFLAEIKRVKKVEPYYKKHIFLWKYFLKWKNLANSNSIEARLPWISFPVISFLESNVSKNTKVFEYGGGGSTLFFTERAGEVVTVEHNKEWFNILSNRIKNTYNWKGIFIEPEVMQDDNITDISNPDEYISSEKEFENKSFYKYASCIDNYSDNYFDVVLVDGRARPSCIKHAIVKIKKGGYLILDNADRDYYTQYFKKILSEEFEIVINYSGPTPFCTWFNRTSVWKKK